MSDVDDLLLTLIRAAVPTGTTVSPEQPPDFLARLPYIVAHRIGGAAIVMGALDRATCDVQVYAVTRRQASTLSQTIRIALENAVLAQTQTAAGHLAFFVELAAPAPLPATDCFRYQATFALGVRPA